MTNLLIELLGAVVGAVLGYWLGRGGSGPVIDNAGGYIEGPVTVDRSSRSWWRLVLHVHPRQVVSGRDSGDRDADDPDRVWLMLGGGGVVMVLLAAGYIAVRDEALLGFRVVSTGLVALCVVSLVRVLSKGRGGALDVLGLGVGVLVTVVTIINRGWLRDPDVPSDRLGRVLESGITLTPGDVLDYLTVEDVTYLSHQAVGLLATGILLVFGAWTGFVLVRVQRKRAGVATVADWNESSRFSYFSTLGLTVLLAAVSVGFSSGWIHGLVSGQAVFPEDPDGEPSAVGSATRSPSDPFATLLCVQVEGYGDPISRTEVSLERKLAGKGRGGRVKAWRTVGDARPLSENGTSCREVDGHNHARFRFSIVVDSKSVHSESLEPIDFSVASNA